MPTREAVLGALSGVRDPELDEPVTDLGFVSDLRISDAAVSVRLRLPTYFCAPNFAYLMVADAREAVLAVPGVRRASVVLEDHYASDELNDNAAFDDAFPGETEGPNLDELRTTFRRKSFVSRQEQLVPGTHRRRTLRARAGRDAARRRPAIRGRSRRTSTAGPSSASTSRPDAPLVVDPDGRQGARRGGDPAPALREDGKGEHRGQRGAVQGPARDPLRRGARVGRENGKGGSHRMKAARLHRYDDSIPTNSLDVEEIDEPKIESPLDVIVRVGAAGLCRTDIHVIEGQWQPIQDADGSLLPYVLGHENSGWVEEVGSAVTNVEVGDTVICHPLMTCGLCRACRAGDDMHCVSGEFPGISRDGGFADLLKTNARAVVKLDPVLEPKDIAALADAGLTAYHAVRKSVPHLYPGTRAVIMGAGGSGTSGSSASGR